jgi:hypothetical protein
MVYVDKFSGDLVASLEKDLFSSGAADQFRIREASVVAGLGAAAQMSLFV